MPQVLELDLSWNDMRTGKGLEMLGTALACGSLSSLQKLNLINCTAIKTLPEAIGELLELQVTLASDCPRSDLGVTSDDLGLTAECPLMTSDCPLMTSE
jgi:hypothetical protein